MKRLHLTLLPLLVAGLVWGAEAPAPLPLTHRQALLLGASNLLQARIEAADQRAAGAIGGIEEAIAKAQAMK